MRYLSSDVGGTFVDLVLVDTQAGDVLVDKVPSTGGTAEGILQGIMRLAGAAGIGLADVDGLVHGFTIATNAWLERRGARVAMVVTRGFRDLLEIGTQQRGNLYALIQDKPAALVPRSRMIEVEERIDAFGDIVQALDASEQQRLVAQVQAVSPGAIALSLIFAHINPRHERTLAAVLRKAMPDVPVYLSSEVNAQIGEYARANTVAAAAYVGPAVDRYVSGLESGLRQAGFGAPLMLMRSDGGVATPAAARRNPATMLLSGPAGGVIAAAELGRCIGVPDLITFDMGGTSADFSLIEGGSPRLAPERTVNEQLLRIEMLDIETISAGGGSIGAVDRAGALRVGPRSAGAQPGPACYGRGGTDPTLTDATLLLGMLDAADFAGGDLPLDLGAARAAIAGRVGDPLGLTVEDAAFGMIAVANAHMRQAIRALSVERGYDIRKFSLLAFGGAGPIFAAMLERDLGIREVLVPPRPGVFAAWGLLLADITHRRQQPFAARLDAVDAAVLASMLGALRSDLEDGLAADGVPPERRECRFFADMRYVGQFHDISVPLPDERQPGWWDPPARAAIFHVMHEQAFGHASAEAAVEIVGLRAEGRGRLDKPAFASLAVRGDEPLVPRARRRVLLDRSGRWHDCPVFARADLRAGDRLPGPAIVSQSDTTVLVLDGQHGTVDGHGVIHIRSGEA